MDIQDYHEINKLIKNSKSIILLTHHNPDGDALGSSMSLYHLFRNIEKNVKVITPNGFPDFLKWIDKSDSVIKFCENETETSDLILNADLIFNLDFNYTNRLEKVEPILKQAGGKKILIDHHPKPEDFNNYQLSDVDACSTCELIYEFIINTGYEKFIDKNVAECLLMGIMTDTVSFTVNCFHSKTFRTIAQLLDYGVDINQIHSNVFDNFSTSRMRLLGYCLNKKMIILKQYNAAYISISKTEIKKYHFKKGDSEGIVNYPLSIKGIKVSVLFIEKPDRIKLSLRSKNGIAVNEFAEKYFNGGGHKNAAGGETYLSMDKTIELFLRLLPELEKFTVHK